ncbi:MAG TPA: hypothetical protein VLM05_14110, partial [Mycobacteriales bacterium]|nr:hypothetical protein [Mycobacteriales bacterium]
APWPAGSPRLAALVDLDPAAGGPLLALTLDRPGGRVCGELVPAAGVLPAALLHLTDDVLPALTANPAAPGAPGPNGTGPAPHGSGPNGPPNRSGPNGAGRTLAANGNGSTTTIDPAATHVVPRAEWERTRQLTATMSAQRDQLAADRDRIARSRDDAVADRDRLRRDHEVLARRLDRLEREAGLRRPPVAERERTAVLAPARREPTLVLAPATAPAPATPAPAPSTSDRERDRDRAWWRGTPPPSTPDPAPAPAPRPAPRKLFRRTRRMIRRLIALLAVLLTLSVVAVVGLSALLNTTPDRLVNRVVFFLDQLHGVGS